MKIIIIVRLLMRVLKKLDDNKYEKALKCNLKKNLLIQHVTRSLPEE